MPPLPGSPSARIVIDEEAFERELRRVGAAAVDPRQSVFGPDSLTWRIDREAAVFLGAARALLLQLAHPYVAAGIAEHSPTLSDPIGRFHRTFRIVFTLVFGARDQALFAARQLHRRHAAISGVFKEEVGPFARGSIYRANDLEALLWVHATLIETALIAHDLVLPPLSAEERERYYAESRLFAAFFGIPQEALPADWREFSAYCARMPVSSALMVGREARHIAAAIFAGTRPCLRPPFWYRALAARLLPPNLRAGFGFCYGKREHRAAERALGRIRALYPRLPLRLRHVAPYQEALAQIEGRRSPGIAVEVLNRLWIGQARMPREP